MPIMHSISSSRLTSVLAGVALLAVALAPAARAAKFPALNTPPSTAQLPGKLVWADPFTNNPDEATHFYTNLLGWTAEPLEQKGKGYTVFSNNGHPVAGLAPRNATGSNHPARWVGYFAVGDIDAALAHVTKNGGGIHA